MAQTLSLPLVSTQTSPPLPQPLAHLGCILSHRGRVQLSDKLGVQIWLVNHRDGQEDGGGALHDEAVVVLAA